MSINKILVVDDSTIDRMNIQNIITDAGYEVTKKIRAPSWSY